MKNSHLSAVLLLLIGVFSLVSCMEWDKIDPPAGNQVYRKLVGQYAFNKQFMDEAELIAYSNGKEPTIAEDTIKGYVAELANGYIRFTNPLQGEELKHGASLTMWIKTSGNSDEVEPVTTDENLSAAIFSFSNEDESQKLFFTSNGWLNYSGDGDRYEVNNPATKITNIISTDKWHFLSVVLKRNGYSVYVDGENKLEENVIEFDFSTIVQSLAEVSYLNLGFGGTNQPNKIWIDDVKVYSDIIITADVQAPNLPPPSFVEIFPWPLEGTVGYYMLDGNFNNALNAQQSGELITMELQAEPSSFVLDAERGTVWNQQEGWAGNDNGWAYTRFDNPLKGKTAEDGISVSLWINPPHLNWWDQIFVLNDGTSKFWFNAIGYVGYNGTGGWFDCHNNNATNALPTQEWTFVTINITPNGFEVYYNGELKFDRNTNAGYNGDLTDFTNVINLFTQSDNFYLGYESWWKAAPAMVDNIYVISRPITGAESGFLAAIDMPAVFGYYPLNNTFDNAYNTAQSGELVTVETQSEPSSFVDDPTRGIVWNQKEGWTGNDNGWAYTRFDNPLKNKVDNSVSVSMWINPPYLNWWDQIFVLNDGTSKLWFNAIGYLGYNGEGGWFDCHNNNATNALTPGEWTFVTINVTGSGFEVYYNGEFKFSQESNAGFAGELTDYNHVINLFNQSDNFYLGYESWWKAAPAMVDDIYLFGSALNQAQVSSLNSGSEK
nr:LamG-like jellyroll fold domain-containing protein [uncultured Carboxylicivirga sp.]